MTENCSLLLVVAFAFGITVMGCSREPLPSPEQDLCAAVCESVACLESELGPDTVRECDVYCLGKFMASEERGSLCQAAYTDAIECLAELTCEQYKTWLASDPAAPCGSARAEVEDACGDIYLDPHILPP